MTITLLGVCTTFDGKDGVIRSGIGRILTGSTGPCPTRGEKRTCPHDPVAEAKSRKTDSITTAQVIMRHIAPPFCYP